MRDEKNVLGVVAGKNGRILRNFSIRFAINSLLNPTALCQDY